MRGDQGEGKRESVQEGVFEASSGDEPIGLPIRMTAIGEPLPHWPQAFLPSAKARTGWGRDVFDEKESSARDEHAEDLAERAFGLGYRAEHMRADDGVHALIVEIELFGSPADEHGVHAPALGFSSQMPMHEGIRFDADPSHV